MSVEFNCTGLTEVLAMLDRGAVLFALRNPPHLVTGDSNVHGLRLKRLRARWQTLRAYDVETEIALGAYLVTGFGEPPGADYEGGTALGGCLRRIGPDGALRPWGSSSLHAGSVRIASTEALTHAGGVVSEPQPFAYGSGVELARHTGAARGSVALDWSPTREAQDHRKGLVIVPGQGIMLRSLGALGAGGSGRLFVDLSWEEL